MRRSTLVAALFALLFVGGGVACAEEPKPAPPPPAVSSDADVAAALEKFKEDFKAKGLKGDDKVMQRDYAMEQLAKLQHPLVVEALAKVTGDPDPMLRTSAVLYLGEQRACPGAAGQKIVAAMRKNSDDTVFVMSALQALGALKYLGARDLIKSSIKEEDFAIKKSAIIAVGETGDIRLLREILVIIGITPTADRSSSKGSGTEPDKSGGGKEVVEEGYSWEGAEATVDWGMSDNTAENAEAERQVKEQIAKNQAEAAKAAGAKPGGGGAPGAGGGTGEGAQGGRGASSRSTQELVPYVRTALRKLTGEQFSSHKSIVKWLSEHREDIIAKKKACDEEEKRQAEAAKAK